MGARGKSPFNGIGSLKGINKGSGSRASRFATKLDNMNKEGKYRYHSTTLNNLESIGRDGLQPGRGMVGNGVYFSYNINDSRDWGEEQRRDNSPVVTLRVANTYLAKTDYEDYDDMQGVSPSTVPANELQIRQAGKWVSLKKFLRDRRR